MVSLGRNREGFLSFRVSLRCVLFRFHFFLRGGRLPDGRSCQSSALHTDCGGNSKNWLGSSISVVRSERGCACCCVTTTVASPRGGFALLHNLFGLEVRLSLSSVSLPASLSGWGSMLLIFRGLVVPVGAVSAAFGKFSGPHVGATSYGALAVTWPTPVDWVVEFQSLNYWRRRLLWDCGDSCNS